MTHHSPYRFSSANSFQPSSALTLAFSHFLSILVLSLCLSSTICFLLHQPTHNPPASHPQFPQTLFLSFTLVHPLRTGGVFAALHLQTTTQHTDTSRHIEYKTQTGHHHSPHFHHHHNRSLSLSWKVSHSTNSLDPFNIWIPFWTHHYNTFIYCFLLFRFLPMLTAVFSRQWLAMVLSLAVSVKFDINGWGSRRLFCNYCQCRVKVRKVSDFIWFLVLIIWFHLD